MLLVSVAPGAHLPVPGILIACSARLVTGWVLLIGITR
jgi:hypothetical protein